MEAFIYQPPTTICSKKEIFRGARSIFVERVPQSLIEEVVINPSSADLLHPSVRFLAIKDFIVANSSLTTPSGNDGPVLTSDYWGRAIPVAHGVIPYSHFVGSIVMTKGVNTSGEHYRKIIDDNNSLSPTPWGFYGDRDSQFEIDINNRLLSEDFRAGLALAYVVLKPEKLMRWLTEKWSGFPEKAADIEKRIKIVTTNGDRPSIFFRVAGVSERLCPTVEGNIERRKAEFARSARLLKTEVAMFPNHFDSYLGRRISREKTLLVLDKISKRQILTADDLEIYLQLAAGIAVQNSLALKEFIKGCDKDKLSLYLPDLTLSSGKDIDFCFFTYDYEELRKKKYTFRPLSDSVKMYLYYIEDIITAFLNEMLSNGGLTTKKKVGDLIKAALHEALYK